VFPTRGSGGRWWSDEQNQFAAEAMSETNLLTRIGSILSSRAKRKNGDHGVRESIAELVAADATEKPGETPDLDRQERALIANVLRLRGTVADDVMIPRADIVAMPIDLTLDQALELIRREGHSRMPVYREQLDDIAGMVHIKDVVAYIGRAEQFRLESILRAPLMVAPQIPVLDLLLQMRMNRMHLALVVDEYGGIDGLLTIEDLVETITGDIADEHDEPDLPMVTERADGTLDIDARMPIEDFGARVGVNLTEEEKDADIDTVGGLVFTLAGRVPTRGEVISHSSGMEFRVLDADARRIRRLRVKPPAEPETAAPGIAKE
jgi:magnesium and cobalt transporter